MITTILNLNLIITNNKIIHIKMLLLEKDIIIIKPILLKNKVITIILMNFMIKGKKILSKIIIRKKKLKIIHMTKNFKIKMKLIITIKEMLITIMLAHEIIFIRKMFKRIRMIKISI